ncbi:MAG: CPBP family intramembrane metalloprotease [Candidatus Aminicenantes bacterium]|nr:MAG: CPBP family intramembrane metalloprotease [Candidatus Aminicenantes bacterium]
MWVLISWRSSFKQMKLHSSRLAIFVEFLIILFLIFTWFIHIIPFASTIFALVFILISIFARRRGLKGIGLVRPKSWVLTLVIGFVGGFGCQFLSLYAVEPLISRITGSLPDLSNFATIKGDTKFLLTWLTITWTIAAFGEEIIYRGYMMNRVSDFFRNSRIRWLIGLFFSSVLFGTIHYYQGLSGMLSTGISGLFFGAYFLVSGRNLWAPILAHGVSNSIGFILIFLGRYPGA